ncbi:hypothetical protein BZA70DRAFT_288379 [Myxozyma melibiosi]|uniref:Uncharacterized protein n=1 Tax=Myxozyma melibiosi TaxID=54550 RepID=A0ABR1FAS4_9ASCO
MATPALVHLLRIISLILSLLSGISQIITGPQVLGNPAFTAAALANCPDPSSSSFTYAISNYSVLQPAKPLGGGNTSSLPSIEYLSRLQLCAPADFRDQQQHLLPTAFQQFGGLSIPDCPTTFTFSNCSVALSLLSNNTPSSPSVPTTSLAIPSTTELSSLYAQARSALVLLSPAKYRCRLLKSERFSFWQILALRIVMRKSAKRELLRIVLDIATRMLNLVDPKEVERLAMEKDRDALLVKRVMRLLEEWNTIVIKLDGVQVDLAKAVENAGLLRLGCI